MDPTLAEQIAPLSLAERARFVYRAHKARWRDQRAAIAELTRTLRPGDVALDVGAHKGSFTYWLARAAAPGKVLALEPQAELARYLRRACAASRLDNVDVRTCAASRRSGRAVLAVPGDGPAHGASLEPAVELRGTVRRVSVDTVALDDVLPELDGRVAAMKIDVEGHELDVLRGAERLVREHGPVLVVEIEARHLTRHSVVDVIGAIHACGYRGHFLRGNALVPVEHFEALRDQRAEGARFWDAPEYCANFVFRR